jgi:hypothetical protein
MFWFYSSLTKKNIKKKNLVPPKSKWLAPQDSITQWGRGCTVLCHENNPCLLQPVPSQSQKIIQRQDFLFSLKRVLAKTTITSTWHVSVLPPGRFNGNQIFSCREAKPMYANTAIKGWDCLTRNCDCF